MVQHRMGRRVDQLDARSAGLGPHPWPEAQAPCRTASARCKLATAGNTADVGLPEPGYVALCDGMCDDLHMATNLAIDPDLLERALRVSGAKSKTAAVTQALTEFIARREQSRLLELFGSLAWDPDFDHKRERTRR